MTTIKLNRDDFKQLTKIRLKESKLLLDNGNYDGAYYLCGYAVECALKACIVKQTNKYDFPDKDTVNDSYCHNLNKLLGLAELTLPAKDERKTNKKLEKLIGASHLGWNEGTRYLMHTEIEAKALYSAITNKRDGVLKWIRKYW